MELIDKQALQEHIMSLIPDTIDTDAGTHTYLLYQERLKIAEAIAAGFIKPIEYYNLSTEEFVDKPATIDMPLAGKNIINNIFGELESIMRIVKYPRMLPNDEICGETIRKYMIMHEDYETIKKKYRDMIRKEVNK